MRVGRRHQRIPLRGLLLLCLLLAGMNLAGPAASSAGVSCQDFGCVKVILNYDGARRMRQSA